MDQKQTSDRKTDHIDLAFASRVEKTDERFNYEPLLSAHPDNQSVLPGFELSGKKMSSPIWVSSMTGGAEKAGIINRNLAKACAEFGMGMGLGSCRIILEDDTYLADFQLRPMMGESLPFFANLGIAQLEELFENGKAHLIRSLIEKTETDGLIIHVNPFQEWLQPEGDRFKFAPIDTIKRTIDFLDKPIIVKEVGQGMGPESLKALFELPVEAVDFAAHGGTNFAMLELLRSNEEIKNQFEVLTRIGHSAEEMCHFTNQLIQNNAGFTNKKVIVSGGVRNFLDGYYYMKLLKCPAIYGQASAFLKYAQYDYESLKRYIEQELAGLKLASAFLTLKQGNE